MSVFLGLTGTLRPSRWILTINDSSVSQVSPSVKDTSQAKNRWEPSLGAIPSGAMQRENEGKKNHGFCPPTASNSDGKTTDTQRSCGFRL